jgi:G3E family GTPase
MSKSKKTSEKIHMSSVRGTDMSELEPITIPVQSGTVLLYTAHHTLREDALKMTSNTSTSTDMTDHHHPHPHMHIVDDSVHHTHAHTHDTAPAPASSDLDHGIATIVLRSSTVSLQKVKHWLVELLWGRRQAESVQGWRELRERLREGETEVDDRVVEDQGMDIFRIKGVLSIYDKDEKYYLQGVMDTFDLAPADCTVGIDIKDDNIDRTELDQDGLRIKKNVAQSRRNSGDVWQEGEERHSSIIIIGVDLDINMIVSGFAQCLEE